jgi:hypothetical protein
MRIPSRSDEERPTTGKRLLWFAAIWLASVAALGILVYGLRALFGL